MDGLKFVPSLTTYDLPSLQLRTRAWRECVWLGSVERESSGKTYATSLAELCDAICWRPDYPLQAGVRLQTKDVISMYILSRKSLEKTDKQK